MEKIVLTKEQLKRIMNGTISDQELLRIQDSYKDKDRFLKYKEILQEMVPWKDEIILRLGDNLFIVKEENGDIVTKCLCGHEFCDFRENWKLYCRINVRRTIEEMSEVYSPEPACPEPGWQEIREFFCPGCGAQLAVEVVPPGYPVIFEMLPDLVGFYRDILGQPLKSEEKYKCEDKSLNVIKKWAKEV